MNLSGEQIAAIQHRGSHLQIIACAGSGKTEVMARRVAALIDEGVLPKAIIAFTFTERAAASLKVRIHKRVAESKGAPFLDKLGPMFIGTIHSYCLRMLQDHVPHFGNHDILDENRLAGLLSREHKRLGLDSLGNEHWAPIADFRKKVRVVENELLTAADIAKTAFGKYKLFLETLNRYPFLSFGQLITAAIKALQDPHIYQRVHSPLQHLLVDEYQDINPAQEGIDFIADQKASSPVRGDDDDQSIYQWRGSDVNNILIFPSDTRPPPISPCP